MNPANSEESAFTTWYRENKDQYESCGAAVSNLLNSLLKQKKIPFQSISCRIKEEKSFCIKCQSGKYSDPITQITDFCGLRIIGYTNQDVEKICKVIEKEFSIDQQNSVNKGTALEADRVGYLSVHYIACFKQSRYRLSEYKAYKGLKFEIQVRTILQHAWAEIEHDRSYKFSGELPREIKRRFYLIAGTLELMDREFERLSNDIDAYAQDVKISTAKGELAVPIDSTSLFEYMELKFANCPSVIRSFRDLDKAIIEDLRLFGVDALKDLDVLISEEILNSPLLKENLNFSAILVIIMLVSNPKKYIEKVHNAGFMQIPRSVYEGIQTLNSDIAKFEKAFRIIGKSRKPLVP